MVADLGTVDMFAHGAAADLDKDAWTATLSIMLKVVAACTIGFAVLHLMLKHFVQAKVFGITRHKDEVSVPNIMVSSTHALFSFFAAIFYFYNGWGWEVAEKQFLHSQYYFVVSTVSVGYIFYDVAFLMFYFEYMKGQIPTIMGHHIIFAFTYFLSQLIPCTLGASLYFWFSLTEISTPFLNYNWFFLKADFSKELWKKNGYLLLLTFGVRWIVTMVSIPLTWWYIKTHVDGLVAQVKDQNVMYAYLGFFSLGVAGMVFLNSYWYSLLLGKAFRAIKDDKKVN